MSAPWNQQPDGPQQQQQQQQQQIPPSTGMINGVQGQSENSPNLLPQLAPPAVNIQIKPEHDQQQHHVTLPSISTISGSNQPSQGQGQEQVQGQQNARSHSHSHSHVHPHIHGPLSGVSNRMDNINLQNGGTPINSAAGSNGPVSTNSEGAIPTPSINNIVQQPDITHQQQQQQLLQGHNVQVENAMTVGQDPLQQAQYSSYRPLNVKDALSYLEQVKFQFSSRPDVYNHFLDIMKDFKSQAIDTPGVIQRVTTLFQGFPNLIQGFNTFLPHGYKIECSTNPNDPIKVTTPFGTTGEVSAGPPTQYQLAPVAGQNVENQNIEMQQQVSQPQFNNGDQIQHQQLQDQLQNQSATSAAMLVSQPQSQTQPQQLHSQQSPQQQGQPPQRQAQQQPQPPQLENQFVNQKIVAAGGGMLGALPGQQKTGEVEFSHAISYVNKIKTRFADQPDIYKQFLEILQTYQREQKPIHEVYAQVTILFQNNPDLLDDFKKFLPDSSVSQQQQEQQQEPQQQQQDQQQEHQQDQEQQHHEQKQQPLPQDQNQQAMLPPQPYLQQNQSMQGQGFYPQSGVLMQPTNLPPLGNFSASGQASPAENSHMLPSMHQHIAGGHVIPQHVVTQGMSNQDIPVSEMRSTMNGTYNQVEYIQGAPGYPQPLEGVQYMEAPMARPEIDLDPSLVPVVPEPIQPPEDAIALGDEVTFFERVKRFIGNKQVYAEFLKILNLYSQDLLTTSELVSKVEFYLHSSKELFDWFKSFVGYQEKPKHIENIVHEKHRLDLDLCEACGPSYKKLPKDDTFMPCSGRDEMCWEVLNDEWVGHPVWASEDSGFIAHRKNQYEDTLFKVEEERHEYDFYIESNLRTIQTLETIANKIANMTNEEKNNFKLPPGLGHTSLTIYKKVVRKVYDKDRGFEIIDALHEHPAVTVPIVLKRLKQKDEEWRRAQREWNKVWRELEQKVYYKSLDHLGLTFKQADKKLLTTKQLLSEISSIKVDQTNKRIHPLTPKPKSQLDFEINDREVLYDILDLVFTFVKTNASYSNSDKIKLDHFFKAFISLFFSYPIKDVNEAVSERSSITDQENGEEDSNKSDSEKSNKRTLSDEDSYLMKDILRRTKNAKTSNSEENQNSSSVKSNEEDETELLAKEAAKPWLLGSLIDEANNSGIVSDRHIFNLFTNTTIYVFFRHLNTLYERLLEVKKIDAEVTDEIKNRKIVQFASDLNLISTQLADMGLAFKDTKAYGELLRLSKRLITGDLDHQWFEESLRQAYKNKAFKIYTIDKVVQSLVKQAHSIITDPKNAMVMVLFEQDRLKRDTTAKDQILYRLKVRNTMGESENMFRIEYNTDSSHVSIQYVAVDDLTLKEPQNMKEKWDYYVTSYSLSHPTEGITQEDISQPFLRKIIEKEAEYLDDEEQNDKFSPEGVSQSKLKVNIHPETYELTFECGSTDVFTRKSVNKFPSSQSTQPASKMDKFLNSSKGWKKNLSTEIIGRAESKMKILKEQGKLEIDQTLTITAKIEEPNEPISKEDVPEKAV